MSGDTIDLDAVEPTAHCVCGGRIVPETNRGVEHLICVNCHVCSECDAGVSR